MKKYVFNDQMQFLQKCYESRDTAESLDDSVAVENPETMGEHPEEVTEEVTEVTAQRTQRIANRKRRNAPKPKGALFGVDQLVEGI